MRKRNELISALSPLKPVSAINIKTGEYVPLNELYGKADQVIDLVQSTTQKLFDENKESLLIQLTDYTGTPQPAEYARQAGLNAGYQELLPREVLAKSRLEKLAQFKLISETASYVLNPNPEKQEPTFNQSINLGAVDKQMASLSLDGRELNLLWKCWDTEYYITFQVPAYVLKRRIIKFSLPTIKRNTKTGGIEFIFNLFEEPRTRKGVAHTVGIDLGLNKPYSMAVINQHGARAASYETSPRLTNLARKRERLISEIRFTKNKIKNRTERGLDSPVQERELELKRNKSTRLTRTVSQQMGSEIAQKLIKYNSSLIKVENLRWVSGTRSSKIGSSRWSHSQQQASITHATARLGFTTKRVSARNTSQDCHSCKNKLTHNTRSRSVYCSDCKTVLDRDFNAAMSIAKQPLPVSKKLNRGTPLTLGTDPERAKEALSGSFVHDLPLLARITT